MPTCCPRNVPSRVREPKSVLPVPVQNGRVEIKASPPPGVRVGRRERAVCACPLARDDAFLAGIYKLYSRHAAVCAAPFVPSSRTRGRISSWRWSASSNCSVRRHARQYVRTCPHVPACVDTARVPFTPMWHGRLLALHPCKSRSNEQTCA